MKRESKIRRAVTLGGIALFVAMPGLTNAPAFAADQVPVNVSYQVTIHGVPLQLAEDNSWWSEAGLKPGNMTAFVAGAQQVAALPSKTWDIGLMGGPPSLLGASRFGLQTVLILIDDSRANGVVARESEYDAIKADPVKALKGKQYLAPANSTSDYAAQACFEQLGLKPNEVQPVNIAPGAIVDAFKGSDIPVGAVWYPHFARMEQNGGKLLCDGKSAGVLVTGNLVVRKEYLEENMETVARFTAMMLRGLKIMADDREMTINSMKKFYDKGGVSLSTEEMTGEVDTRDYWNLAKQLERFDRSEGPSYLDKESTRLADFFNKVGVIPKVLDPKVYINPAVLEYINSHPKFKAFAEGKPGKL